jgi:hypothetical protein
MKVTLDQYITYLQDYKLSKKFSDFGIVQEVDTESRWEGDAFKFLLDNTMAGNNEEEVQLSRFCGDDEILYDGFILHNQGTFNLNRCIANKDINFKSIIDCIKNETYNIFDQTPTTIDTIQGTINRQGATSNNVLFLGEDKFTIDDILNNIPLPPLPGVGWFYESIKVDAIAEQDQQGEYLHHNIFIAVSFIKISSPTQLGLNWLPDPLGGFYYNNLPEFAWRASDFLFKFTDSNNFVYYDGFFDGNKNILSIDKELQNSVNFNAVLENMLNCTGKTIVSNWFDINSDATEPDNDPYIFAQTYLQNLFIVQASDIIRENQQQAAFGQSGEFEVEKMVRDLNNLFNLKIIYDSINDVIRWEHITYWQNKGINLESNNYEYEISDEFTVNQEQINSELWIMARESPNIEFYQTKIDYKNRKIEETPNEQIINIEYFYTDLNGLFNNGDYDTNEYIIGKFFLFATDGAAILDFNNVLSIRNIVKECHYYNRISARGVHDGQNVSFQGFSVGLEGTVKFSSSLKFFNKVNPGNTVFINKGTFLIEEIDIDERDIIELKIRK